MRIDKYLWCVRLQKTRSKSSKFVEGGNVKIVNEVIKKSSKVIKIDQTFSIREQPIWRKYKVLDIPKARVGAKLVADLITEITSEVDLKLLAELHKQNQENRLKGMLGRPTKRNRRDLDDFFED